MRWHALLNCVAVECSQSKASKDKYATFIAGVDHLSDWAIDLGDTLVWEKGSRRFDADTPTRLLPDLYAASSATTCITDYMKAMQAPGLPGSLQKYAPFAIKNEEYGVELPPQPTAKGVRHGACETICIGVPAELGVHNTGHDLTNQGALWEYLNSRVPLCIPGSLLLSGWPGLPYGQTGMGSKYPSLKTLVDAGVSMKRLEAMIDELFGFHDATPPMLLIDGPLRPLMHVTLATMIMYYETRFKSKESEYVLARMRDAYDAKMSTPGFAAHQVLIEWGDALKINFKVDNAHLYNRTGHNLSEQVVAGLQGLGNSVGRMSAQMADLAARTMSLEAQNQLMLQQMQKMMQIIAQQQLQLARQPHTVDGSPAPELPPLPAVASGMPAITPLAGSPSARNFLHASATASNAGPSASVEPARLPQLRNKDLGGQKMYETADKQANSFYLDCMQDYSGNIPVVDSRRKKELESVLNALKAMTSREEMVVLMLKERDPGQQAQAISIADEVVKLLVKRLLRCTPPWAFPLHPVLTLCASHPACLLRAYADQKDTKTPGRLATSTIFVNTLEKHLKSSKLNICSSAFAAWRQAPDAPIVGPIATLFGSKRARSPSPASSDEDA